LILGESILNDAISVLLYRTIASATEAGVEINISSFIWNFCFLFFASVILGFIVGIGCALILKFNFANAEYSNTQENTETSMMIFVPWVSYLVGEGLELSGIVCIMFCGISMAKYALPNLSEPGKRLTRKLYSTMGTAFENLVFIFMGFGFFTFPISFENVGYALLIFSFVIIIFSRFVQIKLLSTILNNFRTQSKINERFQFVMFYSGFRGAMAFALAVNATQTFPENNVGNVMLTLTLFYATGTIFIQGTFLVPILERYDVKEKGLTIATYTPATDNFWNHIKRMLGRFDEDFLQKHLVRDGDDADYDHDHDQFINEGANRFIDMDKSRHNHSTEMKLEPAHFKHENPLTDKNSPSLRSPDLNNFTHDESRNPLE